MGILTNLFIFGAGAILVLYAWEILEEPDPGSGRTVSIWLDPFKRAPHGWTWVRTPAEAIHILKTCEVPAASFGDSATDEREMSDRLTGMSDRVMGYLEDRAENGNTVPTLIQIHAKDERTRHRLTESRDRIRNLEKGKRGTVHFHVDRHVHGG